MGLNGARSKQAEGPLGPDPVRAFEVREPAGRAWRRALSGLTLSGLTLDPRGAEEQRATLLDGHDARLARAGLGLTCAGEAGHYTGRLTALGGGAGAGEPWFGTFELERIPRFVWDLPRTQAVPLAGTLEARALEPLGDLATARERWAVLDEERKVVAWIDDERHRLRPSGKGPRAELEAQRILVRGVRGYGAEQERVVALLAGVEGLARAPEAELDPRVLPLPGGRRPGRWAPFAPGTRAFPALARIVRSQLQVLRANAAGLRANADAEFLHDTRVALRRLRSLLGQLKGVLPGAEKRGLVEELRWLAGCTGPARDLDTLLFELRMSEPELRTDLEPVVRALEEERARLQVELVAAFASPRARELPRRLRAAFAAHREAELAPRSRLPVALLIAKRVRSRLRQVRAGAARVRGTSPPAELHALRIACKKLRYLLECCRGLVGAAELEACLTPLKGLQAVLGTVQDAEIHGQAIRALALGPAAGAGAAAHLALGRFLERDQRRGNAARAHYEEQAEALLAPEARAHFERLRAALERGSERAR